MTPEFVDNTTSAAGGTNTHEVEWDVTWGKLGVRVMAQFWSEARAKGCLMLQQEANKGAQNGQYVSLSEMDVQAQHSFTPAYDGVEYIIGKVSNLMGIPILDIVGSGKGASLVYARHLAMYIAREKTICSTTEIGRLFGGRDSSTVLAALKRFEKRLKAKAHKRGMNPKKDLKAIMEILP